MRPPDNKAVGAAPPAAAKRAPRWPKSPTQRDEGLLREIVDTLEVCSRNWANVLGEQMLATNGYFCIRTAMHIGEIRSRFVGAEVMPIFLTVRRMDGRSGGTGTKARELITQLCEGAARAKFAGLCEQWRQMSTVSEKAAAPVRRAKAREGREH